MPLDWRPRAAAFALGVLLTLGTLALSRHGGLPRSGFGVFLPMTLAGLWVWSAPPEPQHLKHLGWVAAIGTTLGGALAVFGLW